MEQNQQNPQAIATIVEIKRKVFVVKPTTNPASFTKVPFRNPVCTGTEVSSFFARSAFCESNGSLKVLSILFNNFIKGFKCH